MNGLSSPDVVFGPLAVEAVHLLVSPDRNHDRGSHDMKRLRALDIGEVYRHGRRIGRRAMTAKRLASCAGALAGWLCSCAIASAAWQLAPARDGASDRDTKRGFVTATAGDATLRLDCVNGAPLLSISVDRDLSRGMIESSITFDDRKPQPILLQVFSNPRNVPLFNITTRDLMRAKRLRIELHPIEGMPATYDFETIGGRATVKAVVCGPKPKSILRRLRQSR
jgi:hypothetical protein